MNGTIFKKDGYIILIFALLHSAVAFVCRLTGVTEDLMLTVLSMVMVMLLCIRRQNSFLFMAVALLSVNIVGYFLGLLTAAPLKLLQVPPAATYPISTFICTVIIGGGTLWSIGRVQKNQNSKTPNLTSKGLKLLLIAFVAIITVRLIPILYTFNTENMHSFLIGVLLNYICTFCALFLIGEYALKSHINAKAEKEKANLAQYRYHKLKQQVNPHFLFNSLNVLDCMICEQSPQEASEYTHKLAEIYHYMLANEDEITVRLRDEMEFVSKYIDLLNVRFPKGLEVRSEIRDNDMKRSVVPCCVQMLIENATKHNAVRESNPLRISISSDGNSVTVSNNLRPRINRANSTGLGLKYIMQQYEDISGKSITVLQNDESYTVTLPLL